MNRAVKRLICRIVGHRPTAVTPIPGTHRYYSHPRGKHLGCRRCRTVLTGETR